MQTSQTEPELLPIKVRYCTGKAFCGVLLCGLELHIRTWPIALQVVPTDHKWTVYVKAFKSYHITYWKHDHTEQPPTSLTVWARGLYGWEDRHKPITLSAHTGDPEKSPWVTDHTPPGSRTPPVTCPHWTWGCCRQETQLRVNVTGGCWLCIQHYALALWWPKISCCQYWPVLLTAAPVKSDYL